MTTSAAERERALQESTVRFGRAWASGDMAALDELLSPTYTLLHDQPTGLDPHLTIPDLYKQTALSVRSSPSVPSLQRFQTDRDCAVPESCRALKCLVKLACTHGPIAFRRLHG
jgi:hypothetical protein